MSSVVVVSFERDAYRESHSVFRFNVSSVYHFVWFYTMARPSIAITSAFKVRSVVYIVYVLHSHKTHSHSGMLCIFPFYVIRKFQAIHPVK